MTTIVRLVGVCRRGDDTDTGLREVRQAPMALLQPRRMVADEGLRRTLQIAGRIIANPAARSRVLGMRSAFRTHQTSLTAVAIVATLSEKDTSS